MVGLRKLSVRGRRCKFALLVKLYGGDVTPRAVLGELERMNAVVLTNEGTIRMKTARRQSQKQVRQQAIELARLFGDFVGTVAQPLRGAKAPVFFGFLDVPPYLQVKLRDSNGRLRSAVQRCSTASING